MSELSDRISAAIARNTDAEASMLHAFDIPLNRKDFRYVAHICSGELKPDNMATFRVSISRQGGKIIFGFENTDNGNRITISYPEGQISNLPSWLDDDFHIVTTHSINSIDLDRLFNNWHSPNDSDGYRSVAIISLEGMWIGFNMNWVFRQQHLTGNNDTEANDFGSVLPELSNNQNNANGTSFIGGSSIVNANGRISCEPIARVSFKTSSMAKSILGKAGRSKPQGDLIIYFSKDSCAAEGYNSLGTTTLELSPIGGNRQISSYESSIEEDTIMGVKFPYPFHFAAIFSAKNGILTKEDAQATTIDYGVTEHEKPYMRIKYDSGKAIEVVIQSEQEVFKEDDLTLPELKLGSSARAQRTTGTPVITMVKKVRWEDVSGVPEGYEEDVERWFDAYFENKPNSVNEDIELNVSEWFSAFVMKHLREGTPVSDRDRDAYREVISLLNN